LPAALAAGVVGFDFQRLAISRGWTSIQLNFRFGRRTMDRF